MMAGTEVIELLAVKVSATELGTRVLLRELDGEVDPGTLER